MTSVPVEPILRYDLNWKAGVFDVDFSLCPWAFSLNPDLSKRELHFIQNPFKTFKKIFYDDKDKDSLEENEIKNCKDSIVKVVVTHKENPYLFDKFIDLIEEASPQEYQIVEYSPEYEKDNDEIDEAESTLDIFKQYIQKSEIKGINKTKLEKTIIDLYNEAINLE